MSVFVIADLHLSTREDTNKSMEVFGSRWTQYTERLEKNWRALVAPEDTVIIPGDISWALSLEEAREDMLFIDRLPGRKILGKGNHDFWWCTMKKHEEFFRKNGITTIEFLYNNCIEVEDYLIAGSRGWFAEDGVGTVNDNVDFEKLTNRELLRLRMSLDAARKRQREGVDKEILVFSHFPIVWNGKPNEPFCELLAEYGIRRVYFGHIHGTYTVPSVISHEGIDYHLISADYLGFVPKHIPKTDTV